LFKSLRKKGISELEQPIASTAVSEIPHLNENIINRYSLVDQDSNITIDKYSHLLGLISVYSDPDYYCIVLRKRAQRYCLVMRFDDAIQDLQTALDITNNNDVQYTREFEELITRITVWRNLSL